MELPFKKEACGDSFRGEKNPSGSENNTLIVGSGDFDFFFRISYPFFSENIFPEAYLLIYQPFTLFFLIDFYKSNICSLWQVKQWS